MAPSLPFTEGDLRGMAGPTSYARGLGYLDRVTGLEIGGQWVAATVAGTDAYDVRLTFDSAQPGTLDGICSCPWGAEGNFCKHCVATGLMALKNGDSSKGPARATPAPDATPALDAPDALDAEPGSLVSWFSSLTRDELLIELFDLLVDQPELIDRFELRAAVKRVDVEGVRDAVQNLVQVADYIDYDEASAYANDVSRAADAIEELIDAGAATQAIGVAMDAIYWLRESFGMVDDSDGDIRTAGFELLDVHLHACQEAQARPDPAGLGRYLAYLCLTDQYGLAPAFTNYAELLGDAGKAAYRERIEKAYRANPDEYRARQLMESVIEADGDVDALIAFYAAHLDQRGWQHLRIVNKLDAAGRPDAALDWAERGVRIGPRPDARLVDYVVGKYTSAGRAADVLELRRTLFAAERTLANYRALRGAATDCGVWDAEREAARGLLRQDAATARGKTAWLALAGPVLVDALIDDGDVAQAWDVARDIATEPQWIGLANASINDRPADALAVYVKVIDRLTQHTGDTTYQQIAAHLLSARACHEALGTMDKFRQYMVLLRMGQKRKRNLLKILEQNGL